ncbi:MAG: HK97 gp10 family phage protein [Betaproteobacteria bacterium]|nr:HK97 gp10 family phage protein [Betaproteobacteria bacterium]
MTLEIDGIERLKLQLSRLQDVPDMVNQELERCAKEVAKKARNMAPYEYKDLIDAIQVARRGAQGANGRFMKGVSNYEVYINEKHPVRDPSHKGVRTVGEYAWIVHTHMGWGSTLGTLPGGRPFMPNAERSSGPNGEERGGRFLERALEEMRNEINARLGKKYMEAVEG